MTTCTHVDQIQDVKRTIHSPSKQAGPVLQKDRPWEKNPYFTVNGWSVLRDRQVLRLMPWLPLRDLVAVLVWLASLIGHNVVWRGDSFILKDGKLARIDS